MAGAKKGQSTAAYVSVFVNSNTGEMKTYSECERTAGHEQIADGDSSLYMFMIHAMQKTILDGDGNYRPVVPDVRLQRYTSQASRHTHKTRMPIYRAAELAKCHQ
eukprot:SAG31_NODE_19615_length_597_cov_0.626506_1_plen_105_part_00